MSKESSDKFMGSFEEIVGNTVYTVSIYSAADAKETLEQKLCRIIERDIENMMREERTKEKTSEAEESDDDA